MHIDFVDILLAQNNQVIAVKFKFRKSASRLKKTESMSTWPRFLQRCDTYNVWVQYTLCIIDAGDNQNVWHECHHWNAHALLFFFFSHFSNKTIRTFGGHGKRVCDFSNDVRSDKFQRPKVFYWRRVFCWRQSDESRCRTHRILYLNIAHSEICTRVFCKSRRINCLCYAGSFFCEKLKDHHKNILFSVHFACNAKTATKTDQSTARVPIRTIGESASVKGCEFKVSKQNIQQTLSM